MNLGDRPTYRKWDEAGRLGLRNWLESNIVTAYRPARSGWWMPTGTKWPS